LRKGRGISRRDEGTIKLFLADEESAMTTAIYHDHDVCLPMGAIR